MDESVKAQLTHLQDVCDQARAAGTAAKLSPASLQGLLDGVALLDPARNVLGAALAGNARQENIGELWSHIHRLLGDEITPSAMFKS